MKGYKSRCYPARPPTDFNKFKNHMRPSAVTSHPHAKREAILATLCFILTVILYWLLFNRTLHKVYDSYYFPNPMSFYGGLLFIASIGLVFYAAMLYNLCLIGNYLRQMHEQAPKDEDVESIFDKPAPTLTVLVPSYKEERQVIWQTLMSAALSEYPHKRVVLLIDNPPTASNDEDRQLLEVARALPQELGDEFTTQAAIYQQAAANYEARLASGAVDNLQEMEAVATLYDQVADWLESQARQFQGVIPLEEMHFDLRFFTETILLAPATLHRARAATCREERQADTAKIKHHYAVLAAVYATEFSSFERKKYSNLSHDANKAMNLNSYIRLIGHSWKEVVKNGKLRLHKCPAGRSGFFYPRRPITSIPSTPTR